MFTELTSPSNRLAIELPVPETPGLLVISGVIPNAPADDRSRSSLFEARRYSTPALSAWRPSEVRDRFLNLRIADRSLNSADVRCSTERCVARNGECRECGGADPCQSQRGREILVGPVSDVDKLPLQVTDSKFVHQACVERMRVASENALNASIIRIGIYSSHRVWKRPAIVDEAVINVVSSGK